MDTIELTLEKNKSFESTNQTENLLIDFVREEKLLPANDLQGKIDAYEQYLKEKDGCNNYRLIFTIRPYCTNVLFNRITEAVFDEGSNFTRLITKENETTGKTNFKGGELGYAGYKNVEIKNSTQNNYFKCSPITRDTGYSSNLNGNFLDYHCGIDIFNNHMLRKNNFVCINKKEIDNTAEEETNPIPSMYFNTLFDKVRDPWGNAVSGLIEKSASSSTEGELHLYNIDNIYSFNEAISKNLHEENGWFGFYNYSLPKLYKTCEKDFGGFEKIINNKEACSFIDLYPGKKEYTFAPQYNKKRKRVEKNWECFLTYPYSNDTSHYLVHDSDFNINGILCDLDEKITIKQLLGLDEENPVDIPAMVLFRTHTKHSLIPGDRIRLHIYNDENRSGNTMSHVIDNVVISSVGKNSYDIYHYFSVRLNDISTELSLEYNEEGEESNIHFRFEKKVNNNDICKYYLRKFKKLPNFKDTSINDNYKVPDEDLQKTLENYDYRVSLNKLGFSKTIYGDDIVQIIYEDDVNTKGIYDNLGREISTIYLTIVKTNNGYKKWYDNDNPIYTSSDIEYSHCFGRVTSGFDLPVYVDNPLECNVRKQHNIDWAIDGNNYNTDDSGNTQLEYSSNFLDDDISKTGGHNNEPDTQDYVFYGDLVELNEGLLEETILENVYHRFNTAQRETNSAKFKNLTIDYIASDDFDIEGFKMAQINGNINIGKIGNAICNEEDYANLAPEGYYYRAHYPVKLKEYDTIVNVGYHTKVNFTWETGNTITTYENYYFEIGQEVYLFLNNNKYVALITGVTGDDFTNIDIDTTNLPEKDLSKYIILKPNPIKPVTAYDFNNTTGKYVWRDILPSSKIPRGSEIFDSVFTNGGIYYYKDINFYVKRQDPYGEFGLLPSPPDRIPEGNCITYADLEILGDEKNVTNGDYFEEGENNIC